MNTVQVLALVALVLLFGAAFWFGRRGAAAAVPVDPHDPLWIAAIERARATVNDMRALQQSGHEVWVKFALPTASAECEHFWGRIERLQDEALVVAVETKPVSGGAVARQVTVQTGELEDWQVELADGSIRGGFTTRAQVTMARRDERHVPAHIAEMLGRMTDT